MTVDQLRALLDGVPGHHFVLTDGRRALDVEMTSVKGENGGPAVNVVSGASSG